MSLMLGAHESEMLLGKVNSLSYAAKELSSFAEQDPGLAGSCGVEVNALEVRSILAGGSLDRVAASCAAALRGRHAAQIKASDLESIQRLEGVLSLAASRMDLRIAAMDAASASDHVSQLGSAIGLATGAIGLWKSIF